VACLSKRSRTVLEVDSGRCSNVAVLAARSSWVSIQHQIHMHTTSRGAGNEGTVSQNPRVLSLSSVSLTVVCHLSTCKNARCACMPTTQTLTMYQRIATKIVYAGRTPHARRPSIKRLPCSQIVVLPCRAQCYTETVDSRTLRLLQWRNQKCSWRNEKS
jgi:hypothetical protein